MSFQFENPDVAAKYEPVRSTNGKVHVPSGKVYGSGYGGPLSKISLVAADKAFASGCNLLKLKKAEKEKPLSKTASKNGVDEQHT